MSRYTAHPGFSIIEIIIGILIITMLVGLSYAGYAKFNHRQELISSGQNLKNTLRDIQSRNFNNEVDCTICDCSDPNLDILEGWYVDLSNKRFYGRCQGKNFMQTNFNLPSDIVINANNSLFLFVSDPPRASSDTTICLSLSDLSGLYYRIDIQRSGEISDSGGLTPVCVP